MKSLRIICSLFALLFITTACNQERVNLEPSPQKEGCIVRGFIDNGSGRLVEIGTLRAIDQDGINVTGDGAYFFNQECLLRIFRTTKRSKLSTLFLTTQLITVHFRYLRHSWITKDVLVLLFRMLTLMISTSSFLLLEM